MIEIPLLWILPVVFMTMALCSQIIAKNIHHLIARILIIAGCFVNLIILWPTSMYLIIYPSNIPFTSTFTLNGLSILLSINYFTTIFSISLSLGLIITTIISKRRFFSRYASLCLSMAALMQLLFISNNPTYIVILFISIGLIAHYLIFSTRGDEQLTVDFSRVFFWARVCDSLVALGILLLIHEMNNALSSFCFLLGIFLRTSQITAFNTHVNVLSKMFSEFRVFFFYVNYLLPLCLLAIFNYYIPITNNTANILSALNAISIIYTLLSLVTSNNPFQFTHCFLLLILSTLVQLNIYGYFFYAACGIGILFTLSPFAYKVTESSAQEGLVRDTWLYKISRGIYAPSNMLERVSYYIIESIAQAFELIVWPFILRGFFLRAPAIIFSLVKVVTKLEHSGNVKRTFVIVLLVTCLCALWYV